MSNIYYFILSEQYYFLPKMYINYSQVGKNSHEAHRLHQLRIYNIVYNSNSNVNLITQ